VLYETLDLISVKRGNYIEMLKLHGNHVADLRYPVDKKGVFRGPFPEI
jgi:hypothetical protein